jgi:hypothetical protein
MWLSADRRLIHADASATSLALLRVWVFGLWAVFAWRDPLHLLAELPAEIFLPLGVLRLAPSQEVIDLFLSPAGLRALKAAVVIFSAAAAAGVLTRVTAVLAALALIVWQTINRGFAGYVNHAEIPLLLAAIVLAVSPCDRALTIRPRPRREPGPAAYQFPLVAILALICTTYLFIGSYRVAHGGVALLRSEALSEWILSWNLREPDPAATLGVRWIANPGTELAGRVGFGMLTLLEVTAPLCLLSARYRAFFLVAMLLAHSGILLLMRIDFTAQVLSYLVFIDSRHWSPVPVRGTAPPIVRA